MLPDLLAVPLLKMTHEAQSEVLAIREASDHETLQVLLGEAVWIRWKAADQFA